jgi:hypothetical protein
MYRNNHLGPNPSVNLLRYIREFDLTVIVKIKFDYSYEKAKNNGHDT